MAMNDSNQAQKRIEIIDMLKELTTRFSNIRDNLCEPYGLSSLQAVIIMDIYHNPDNTRVTDICKRLHKSTNSISPLINRLVEKGYLTKSQSKEDKRITYVSLTKKTEEITNSILIDVSDYTWPFFEGMSDEKFDKIYEALKVLLEVTRE